MPHNDWGLGFLREFLGERRAGFQHLTWAFWLYVFGFLFFNGLRAQRQDQIITTQLIHWIYWVQYRRIYVRFPYFAVHTNRYPRHLGATLGHDRNEDMSSYSESTLLVSSSALIFLEARRRWMFCIAPAQRRPSACIGTVIRGRHLQ